MRVAITGANGFLAKYLASELLSCGQEIVLLSRSPGNFQDYAYVVTDYSVESLSIALDCQVDAIAHLASSRTIENSMVSYSDQLELTENLYSVAADKGISNIVFTSSISVYSGSELPYREIQPAKPANRYGLLKLTCEQIGNIMSETGLRVKNLRLAHLYGANEHNNYMVNVFFRRAFAQKKLYVSGRSDARREMLYAKDAARAIFLSLKKEHLSGTYNIGSGEALTNEEIARIVCEVMTPQLQIEVGNERVKTKSSYMDYTRAANQIGYSPQYSMREAVAEIEQAMQVPILLS